MSVFIVSRLDITDHESMKAYMAAAPATVALYGGEYVVRAGEVTPIENDKSYDRAVIVKFQTREDALSWYGSAEYAPLRADRLAASSASMLLLEGLEG